MEFSDKIIDKKEELLDEFENLTLDELAIKIKETTEVNGVRFPSGIQIDVTDEDSKKMIDGGKAILLEDLETKESV